MFAVKVQILAGAKLIVITLIAISWILFAFIVISMEEAKTSEGAVPIRTVDMGYKALENFLFLSISGVFLFT